MFAISANRLRNWLAEDPLIDWLEYWGTKLGFQKSSKNNNKFHDWIQQNGIQWEKKEINQIQSQSNISFHIFPENPPQTPEEWENRSKNTEKLLEEGVSLIVHPVLCSTLHQMFPNEKFYEEREMKFWGIPDVLIHRSLWNQLPCLQHITFPKNGNYLVGDWKQNTMITTQHGDLRIQKRFKPYFSQIWLYQCALQAMKPGSVITEFGGLIPKEYRIGTKGFRQPGGLFQSYGLLTCQINQELEQSVHEGIQWLWNCYHHGKKWDPRKDYQEIPELRPNLKNHRDERWKDTKVILARMQQDYTQLPFVTPSVRKRALDHNDGFGFNPKTKRAKIVHKSMSNLQNPEGRSWSEEVAICKENYPNENFDDFTQDLDKYRWIDLEFIPAGWFTEKERINWERINQTERHPICVIMGWSQKLTQTQWSHKQFQLQSPTRQAEKELWNHISHELKEHPEVIWVHWGSAERTMFRQAVERGDLIEMPKLLDLMSFFQKIQFLPAPLLDFSLKLWGNMITRRKLLPISFPKEWGNDEEDLGTFWIPSWMEWFQGGNIPPSSSNLLSYHRRDIYWLSAIHENWKNAII